MQQESYASSEAHCIVEDSTPVECLKCIIRVCLQQCATSSLLSSQANPEPPQHQNSQIEEKPFSNKQTQPEKKNLVLQQHATITSISLLEFLHLKFMLQKLKFIIKKKKWS